MNLNTLQHLILAQAGAAAAPASAPPMQEDPKAAAIRTIGMFVLIFVALYFVMIRPQSKKAKEHALMLKTVKPGDKVVTSSGIKGIVVSVKDDAVTIRSAETKLEILKSAVSEIRERAGETATSES